MRRGAQQGRPAPCCTHSPALPLHTPARPPAPARPPHLDKAQRVGEAREGGGLAVAAPHAAARHQVEPCHILPRLIHDHHQAQVVREEVERVVAGDCAGWVGWGEGGGRGG